MEAKDLDRLLSPYNPWWAEKTGWETSLDLPEYQRPVVQEVLSDLHDLRQAVSITGPRRVGKSTAVRHVISRLIGDRGVEPRRLLYFSFDDPQIAGSKQAQQVIFDLLVDRMRGQPGKAYLFLD